MSSNSCWCLIDQLVIVWLCFGMSHGNRCGKFQYQNNAGYCRPCRKCPENIDDAVTQGTIVDECRETALPTPDWLAGFYFCQGISDPLPECKKWSPQNGSLSCSHGTKIESFCRLHCDRDFYSSLNESIQCTGDLDWSKPLPYCVHINDTITTTPPPACPEWSPLDGRVSCTQSRDVGSICTLSCNQGFNPSSTQSVTCSKELQWDKQLPFCILEPTTTTPKPSCEPLEVANGTLYCSEGSFSGSECSVICNDGFTLLENINITCTNNLTWSELTPSCVEIQKTTTQAPRCSDVIVDNGTLSCTDDFNVGSYCNVTCTGEFKSTSNEWLYCRPDQTWNQPSPLCDSPVPDESRKRPENSFPWYIIGICVGMIVFVIIIVIIMYLKICRNRMENNTGKKRKGSDAIELESISALQDSDCNVCGKCCDCLLPKKKNKGKSNQPIAAAGSSSYQPIDEAESSSNAPIDEAESSSNAPIDEAESSSYQPIDEARSSSFQPIDAAESSSYQPIDEAESSSYQPIDEAESSSEQPIDSRDVLTVVCPRTGRPRQISKECATAQNLIDSFEDMDKLRVFFDQYEGDYVTWKYLAAEVLKLGKIDIDHIEYKFKGSNSTGPTERVFGLMKENGTTLFEVIKCLHGKKNHKNVVEALEILYKYCGEQLIHVDI